MAKKPSFGIEHAGSLHRTADVMVIGAGLAGLYLIRKLRDEMGLDVAAYERGSDVGGTWFWNRYPGARCDVESIFYSYSFDPQLEQEWDWSERYSTQEEILRYINHVADRFDLRRSIQFGTTVLTAEYSEDRGWTITTDTGHTTSAPYLVTAVGCLSVPSRPDLPGIGGFDGDVYHTGDWPKEGVDFSGMRVGVIGTGSSGVQLIPLVAGQADELTVFQRTASFSVPARSRPLTEVERRVAKSSYPALRHAARYASRSGILSEQPMGTGADVDPMALEAELERRWWVGGAITNALKDTATSLESNEKIAEFVRRKIRQIVKDPDTARLLEPHDHPIGTKRLILNTDYYETYNRPNVRLVSVREHPIEQITADGIVAGGVEHKLDAIVLATGYDAMTGALNAIDIRGRDGRRLRDEWREGPKTYLGVAVHGFPNLFTVTGPGSPSVLSNMVLSIEQHVEWIAAYIGYLRENVIPATEPDREAQTNWVEHVNEVASLTLYPTAASWYLGANIPGKPRVFMPYIGGFARYQKICDDVRDEDYRGFIHSR